MIAGVRPDAAAVIGATAVAGLAGFVVALGSRSADTEFVAEQRNPPQLQAQEVDRVVASAPDPLTGKGRGQSARCTRGGSGQFGNPWKCSVSYRSGRKVQVTVRVLNDGTYEGRYAGGGAVSGCCLNLPGAE